MGLGSGLSTCWLFYTRQNTLVHGMQGKSGVNPTFSVNCSAVGPCPGSVPAMVCQGSPARGLEPVGFNNTPPP